MMDEVGRHKAILGALLRVNHEAVLTTDLHKFCADIRK